MSSDPHRLNAADRFMLLVDRTIRGLGGPGFETLTFVRLDGRADRAHLRRGLAGLNRAAPTVTARLRPDASNWDLRPDAKPTFEEIEFSTADPQALLDYAGRLLGTETDPGRVDPMRFQLLHLPDGDVFLARYSHVLLDHNHAIGAIRRIDELGAPDAIALPPAPVVWRDPVWAQLRQFPRALRKRAARDAGELRKSMRGGALKLGRPLPAGASATYSILQRSLTAEQTRAVETRVRGATGVPNLSMALLSSAFLGIDRLTANQPNRGTYYQAGIALDLGLRNRPLDILENLATLIPLRVPVTDATDRDALTRLLARQLLDHLTARTDIGILQHVAALGRTPSRAQWVIDLLMRYCVCFWYGYLGPLRMGPTFCGAPVADVFSAGPTWPAVGVTLLANQFAGRLHMQLTHVPQSVPHATASAYLDGIVGDLLAGT
jgi:hypothetical protein